MIHIPPDKYISGTLQVGTIFKLCAPELIDTDIPHYFIIVAIDDDDIHMVVCTTQKDKKEEYFRRMKFDPSGLVHIEKDSNNGLTEYSSYVDCNQNHSITKETLIQKKEDGILEWIGGISYNHYGQIRTGIINSTINFLPKDLLVHPED